MLGECGTSGGGRRTAAAPYHTAAQVPDPLQARCGHDRVGQCLAPGKGSVSARRLSSSFSSFPNDVSASTLSHSCPNFFLRRSLLAAQAKREKQAPPALLDLPAEEGVSFNTLVPAVVVVINLSSLFLTGREHASMVRCNSSVSPAARPSDTRSARRPILSVAHRRTILRW